MTVILTSELLRGVTEHLLVGAVDLDLGDPDHSERHPLGGVHPEGLHLECHGVKGQPLDRLHTGEHQSPAAHNVLWVTPLQ